MNRKSKPKSKKFNADLEWGNHFEWATINFIQDYFNKVLNPKGKRLEFHVENYSTNLSELKKRDMKYAIIDTQTNKIEKYITFEIKADRFAKTGNLIFEKKCSKKDTGINLVASNLNIIKSFSLISFCP